MRLLLLTLVTLTLLLAAAGCGGPLTERAQARIPVALKFHGDSAFDGVRLGDVVNLTGRLKSVSAGADGAAVLSEEGVKAVFTMRRPPHRLPR